MNVCHNDPIGRLLYLTTMALKNHLENRLKPFELTAEQFHVLKCVSEEGRVTQNRIGEAVVKSPGNMTRILDRLEKKGCIERRTNPEDRRSTLIHLTVNGEELLTRVRDELQGFEAEITAGLDDRRVQEIKDGLRTIHDTIVELTRSEEK